MSIPSYFKLKGDTVVWVIFFSLCIISLVEVFSAGSSLAYKEGGNFWNHFIRHGIFLAIGAITCVAVHNIPCNYFKYVPFFGWPLAVGLLFAVWVMGIVTNGAARWLTIAGVKFQPSEFAKGALIITVALILSKFQRNDGADKVTMKFVLWLTIPIVLLIFTENFSTGVLLFLVVYIMMYIGRVSMKQLGKLALVGVAFAGLFSIMLFTMPKDSEASLYKAPVVGKVLHRFPVWRERILSNDMQMVACPDSFVVTDENRQKVHARIAVATCNRGIGKMPGNSVERDFLSQAYSDFIYAIIVEECGIWGAAIVVLLYLILLYRAGLIASKCGKNFPAFVVMGLGIMMVAQAVLNMMVAVGLFPVTGQTLPMISRGGTSIIITCMYFGIILSISRYAQARQKQADKNVIEDPADAIAVHHTESDEIQ